jgi:hypothetical protein
MGDFSGRFRRGSKWATFRVGSDAEANGRLFGSVQKRKKSNKWERIVTSLMIVYCANVAASILFDKSYKNGVVIIATRWQFDLWWIRSQTVLSCERYVLFIVVLLLITKSITLNTVSLCLVQIPSPSSSLKHLPRQMFAFRSPIVDHMACGCSVTGLSRLLRRELQNNFLPFIPFTYIFAALFIFRPYLKNAIFHSLVWTVSLKCLVDISSANHSHIPTVSYYLTPLLISWYCKDRAAFL